MKITHLTSLAVATPNNPSATRFFAVMVGGLFVRRRVSDVGYGDVGNLESRRLGNGRYAHYDLVAAEDATRFADRQGAELLHLELVSPVHATIVCVD